MNTVWAERTVVEC